MCGGNAFRTGKTETDATVWSKGTPVVLHGVVVESGKCGATGVKVEGVGHDCIITVPGSSLTMRQPEKKIEGPRLVYSPPQNLWTLQGLEPIAGRHVSVWYHPERKTYLYAEDQPAHNRPGWLDRTNARAAYLDGP